MRKKGSIIILLDSEGMEVKNFLYMLSGYKGIQNYELILAYQKDQREYINIISSQVLGKLKPVYCPMEEVGNTGRVYNAAAGLATADALIFMDMQMVLIQGCLDEMMKSLEEDRVLAVQPMIIKFHSALVKSTGYVFSESSTGHALQNRQVKDEIVNKSFERSALITSLMAVNRLVFEELRGFNSNFPKEWLGRELTMRITMKGYKNMYNHRARAYDMVDERGMCETGLIDNFWFPRRKECFFEMKNLLKTQIKKNELEKKYIVINFSGIMQIQEFLNGTEIRIQKVIHYTVSESEAKIRFEKILPFYLMEEKCGYIYIVNNFVQIKDNPVWFATRKKTEDMIIDLSGNVIKVGEL